MLYNMEMESCPLRKSAFERHFYGKRNTSPSSAYTSNSIGIGNNFTLSLGLNAQLLTLNKSWTLEPRIGMKWQATSRSSFALAYGLHSRMEKMDAYYTHFKQATS